MQTVSNTFLPKGKDFTAKTDSGKKLKLAEIWYNLIEKLSSTPGLSGILVFCIPDNEASDGRDKMYDWKVVDRVSTPVKIGENNLK